MAARLIAPRSRSSSLPSASCFPYLPFIIALSILLLTAKARSADWHVAPAGNDSAPGTLDQPFASVQRAQQGAEPGDTVFIRGGIYRPTESDIARRRRIFASLILLDKSGAPGKPIHYRAYRDEKPVFDCTLVQPRGQRVSAFHVTGSWLHLEGIEVTGVQVTMTGHTQSICFESQGSNNVFERLSMRDGQAIGIYHTRGSNNLFLNCDAWNNWDNTSGDKKGGNVDGFGCHPPKGSVGNVFRGCRAWFNSDDGFDTINAHEPVVLENCWAAYNGLSPDRKPLADGHGFKIGGYGIDPRTSFPNPVPRHVVRFCVAVGNRSSGFYANHHPGGSDWLHNTGFRNGTNFNMLGRALDHSRDVDGFGHVLKNNLSYRSRNDLVRINHEKCELAGNSFALDLTPSDRDFVSLDESQLFLPRQPRGALPAVDFLHLAKGSPLIDAGVKTGLPFHGTAPDIGAFEH